MPKARLARRKTSSPSGPIPAAALGMGPFKITQVSEMGYCCPVTGKLEFAAPPLNDPDSAPIRAHEYGHLSLHRLGLSPTIIADLESEGLENGWIQAGLDWLANQFMAEKGVAEIADLKLKPPLKENLSELVPELQKFAGMYMVRAAQLNSTHRKLRKRLLSQLTERQRDRFTRGESYLRVALNYLSAGRPNEAKTYLETGIRTFQSAFATPPTGWTEHKASEDGDDSPSSGDLWGKMSLIDVPLSKARKSFKRKTRKYRKDFAGTFRFPLEALVPLGEGMLFGTPKREATGSILVDLSGSMSFQPEQLREILELAPGATIAGYASTANVSDGYTTGVLGLLAQKGKVFDGNYHDYFGGGNVVDGPALEWLAQQPEPRIWVCDGGVTGPGDRGDYRHHNAARDITDRGRIVRVARIEDAQQLLRPTRKKAK